MQCVIRHGEDYVFAIHPDGQAGVAAEYPGSEVTGPEGGPVTIPAGEVVDVPRDFHFALDELGRLKDPRRFAGAGSTPLGAG